MVIFNTAATVPGVFRRLFAAVVLSAATTMCAFAQDFASLPEIGSEGQYEVSAEGLAWLSVNVPGVYRLALDGPGLLAIARFRTQDGRSSDGSERLDKLRRAGSPFVAGVVEDVLLEPGQSYLLQVGAAEPREILVSRTSLIDRSTARPASPGGTVILDAGNAELFEIDDDGTFEVEAASGSLRLEAIAAPGAELDVRIGQLPVRTGGLWPLLVPQGAKLTLRGKPGPGGDSPLVLLRTRAVPDGIDDIEPGPTELGVLSDDGADLNGVLLAHSDRDSYSFRLQQSFMFDVDFFQQSGTDVLLRLLTVDGSVTGDILRMTTRQGRARRAGLMLEPGDYRLVVEGAPPAPANYSLSLLPARGADPLTEGEPDDIPERARTLTPGSALLGHLGPDDPDFVQFVLQTAGRLWEIRAVQGVESLLLTTSGGRRIGTWNARGGAVVLPLGLPPDRYVMRLRGNGRYAVRLSDAGPLPEGFEVEPNDSDERAQRLFPGNRVQGGFLLGGDRDLFEVITEVPTPLTLRFRAPDDGASVADLHLSGNVNLRGEFTANQPEVSYSVMFPAGRNLIDLRAREGGVSGRWSLSVERSEAPENGEPNGVVAMPRDGVLSGRIGGFDPEDRVFVPLPEGDGDLIIACEGAFKVLDLRTYGDDQRLIRLSPGVAGVVPYGQDLGGGVEMRLFAQQRPGNYECRIAFPPQSGAFSALAHDEATDADAPTLLPPNAEVAGQFGDGDRSDRLSLLLEPGALSALSCRDGSGAALPLRRLRPVGSDALALALRQQPLADGSVVIMGPPSGEAVLELRPDGGDAAWRCSHTGADRFRAPSDMGAMAPFTAPRDRARNRDAEALEAYDPQAALAVLSGGQPDWLAPTQVRDDLDVAIAVDGLETPLRGYSRLGQTTEVIATITNPGAPLELDVTTTILADGWRVSPASAQISIGRGETATLPLSLTAPPMQSDVTRPALRLVAISGSLRRALTVPIALDPLVPDQGPMRFWSAPAALRGGLDPLRYQFGARLLSEDGAAVDERRAADQAHIHDGLAQHTRASVSWRTREMILQLTEPAPIVGMFLHLRSANSRDTWPDRVTVELSPDGHVWSPAFDVRPTASDRPQYFVLDAPVTAGFARLIRHGCRNDPDCPATTLADIGLVADPGWRFATPVNIADPGLGGHVVYARELGGSDRGEKIFGGNWNAGLLTADKRPARLSRATARRGNRVEAVLAFHETRAARIRAIEWQAHPDDDGLSVPVPVAVSLDGPAGPWQEVGVLVPPADGAETGSLEFVPPLWARAVRLVFKRPVEGEYRVPDRVLVWEDPSAPPIHGLWEDDRADAGFEATVAPPPAFAPAPAGGATPDSAPDLIEGETVRSSVQLERNADWWRISVDEGPPRLLTLRFPGMVTPDVSTRLSGQDGEQLALSSGQSTDGNRVQTAIVPPGSYLLEVYEPPRSVAILWDTSGSVADYIPRTLAAVRVWAGSLIPGRDRLQLLPFGVDKMLLPHWAESPAEVIPALIDLPANASSDSEGALRVAAADLSGQEGQRGIVIFTDGETSQTPGMWQQMLAARPRLVALSIDTSDPQGERIMKDWVSVNDGHFLRVVGQAGLADGMDLAAALFRAPKGYALTLSLEKVREPVGTATLRLDGDATDAARPAAPPGGAIELILDASGSMLKRLPDGQRRIAVAHRALASLVENTLPPGTPFAFRAFGLEEDACRSELLLPLGPLDPAAAADAIRGVPAINLARTAIAKSLALAADDLAEQEPPLVIVLVTDGEETCDGDIDAQIASIRKRGIDLRLTIVGFAIDDAELAATFARWAEAGGGQYLSADDADALGPAIDAAIAPRFSLVRLFLDGREAPAGMIGLGEVRELPAGRYRLTPIQTAQGEPLELLLDTGADKTLYYDNDAGLSSIGGDP
ncbi:MAG: VWA domain-containing protein [Gammaproteobacteria bacterium]